jgi:hypothetical protein
MHLTCRGVQDDDDTLANGFCPLSCETARGDRTQPDDLITSPPPRSPRAYVAWSRPCGARAACHAAAVRLLMRAREMHDVGGPAVSTSAVAHALHHALAELQKGGVPPEWWATLVHMCAS